MALQLVLFHSHYWQGDCGEGLVQPQVVCHSAVVPWSMGCILPFMPVATSQSWGGGSQFVSRTCWVPLPGGGVWSRVQKKTSIIFLIISFNWILALCSLYFGTGFIRFNYKSKAICYVAPIWCFAVTIMILFESENPASRQNNKRQVRCIGWLIEFHFMRVYDKWIPAGK